MRTDAAGDADADDADGGDGENINTEMLKILKILANKRGKISRAGPRLFTIICEWHAMDRQRTVCLRLATVAWSWSS